MTDHPTSASPAAGPAFTTLIDAATLGDRLARGVPTLVLDAGFDLADPGRGEREYAAGHVPGSLYVHLDRDLSTAKDGRNGRHPLPARAEFARIAGAWGLQPSTQVVVLDRQGGTYAARVWWMLRWLGHEAVAVLDGGFAAWLAAGGESTAIVQPATPASPYPERPPLAERIDAPTLLARLGGVMVLDARPAERFRGDKEPIDPVAGHIPGAHNRAHASNLAPDGRFKPAASLREEFEATLGSRTPGEVVHSCGSGVTACHNLLAMTHAGLPGSVLYAGSWSEWSADPARPVARG